RVKIYATDLDEEALYEARQAHFGEPALQHVPEEFRAKYFTQVGNVFAFRSDLRRNVIFGRHDLVQDAPISHLNLLVCRNTLMYMNADTQSRILTRFHYALDEGAVLFLGKAETLLAHSEMFEPIDVKNRIFRKLTKKSIRDQILINHAGEPENFKDSLSRSRMRELSFDAALIPQIVVDTDGLLILANQSARKTFSLREEDINRPLQNLEISYRPIELRALIDRAYAENRSIRVSKVERQSGDTVQYYDVEISPLPGEDLEVVGVNVSFTEVTAFHQIYDELLKSNQEFEASNEELSSAHEELQSTNEELETTAQELRQSGMSLNVANSFLNSILASLRSAICVVDDDLKILVWNDRAEDMWGLRASEVLGVNLQAIDIGLSVEILKEAVRKFLHGSSTYDELLLEGVNRKGKTIKCKIRISPLIPNEPLLSASNNEHYRGVVIMIDEVASSVDSLLT
ncbi:MAG: PAS domain-containing protein, partial [Candidatus Melainabacteria bacterium]|nr:PAS domain-containing protein [Candidatus Melainabacteria bacterium]